MTGQRTQPDPQHDPVRDAWNLIASHPLFRPLGLHLTMAEPDELGQDAWAIAVPDGWIRYHPTRPGESAKWAWMFAHAAIHLGLGHADPRLAELSDLGSTSRYRATSGRREAAGRLPEYAYQAACCVTVDRFLAPLKIGCRPFPANHDLPVDDELTLAANWRANGIPGYAVPIGAPDFLIGDDNTASRHDFQGGLAAGIATMAARAVDMAAGIVPTSTGRRQEPWDKALSWFVTMYPLLGALAAGMTIVADANLARGWQISVAAISPYSAEIYVNPFARLSDGEWRFVLAHEMLHAALRHAERTHLRDPYAWNVACDYVVNGWLVHMAVGEMPENVLYDSSLSNMSCEAVYERIVTDLRRLRKLATMRGRGVGDILDRPPGLAPGRRSVDLDEYYRNALMTGLIRQQNAQRGVVPAGLEQEIRALDQPPIPWDAALARWFDEFVPAAAKRRSYARPSRHQASTPEIPRAGWIWPAEVERMATFGVVLDSSGSMDTQLLGLALGAVAAFALARDVRQARVIFCDAVPYDAGYLQAEEIAGRIKVRGRGGTALQPGINLLENSDDFPPHGPILVITDGKCDVLRIHREHAYLLPVGASLPFRPQGPVFHFQ